MNDDLARELIRRAWRNGGSIDIDDANERTTARALGERGYLAVFIGRTLTLTDQGHDYCRFAGWTKRTTNDNPS